VPRGAPGAFWAHAAWQSVANRVLAGPQRSYSSFVLPMNGRTSRCIPAIVYFANGSNGLIDADAFVRPVLGDMSPAIECFNHPALYVVRGIIRY
jgi:hypothetical protein